MLNKVKLCFTIGSDSYYELGGLGDILKIGIRPNQIVDNCSGKENSIACISAYKNNTEMNIWSLSDFCQGAVYHRIEFIADFDKIYLDNECFEYCLSIINKCPTYEDEIILTSKIKAINEDFTQIKLQDIFNHNLLTEEQFNNNQIEGIVYYGDILHEQITRVDIIINRDIDETYNFLPNPQILETIYCKEETNVEQT